MTKTFSLLPKSAEGTSVIWSCTSIKVGRLRNEAAEAEITWLGQTPKTMDPTNYNNYNESGIIWSEIKMEHSE